MARLPSLSTRIGHHRFSEAPTMFAFRGPTTQAGKVTRWNSQASKLRLEPLEDRTLLNIDLGPIVNPANGHMYYRLTQSTWTAAESEAVGLGGHLATINDANENEWVASTFGSPTEAWRIWIGL